MNLANAIIEILLDEGVDRVFGNPGTTELPLVDALGADARLPYVLGTHEGPLVAMADGFSRGTGRPSFVNLHVAAGTANGTIAMLNASRSRVPMVILAGQQDSRHLIQDPMLSGNLVGLARSATKSAVEARRADEVPLLLRRAFRSCLTPPEGPVFVSVPMDMFDEQVGDTPPARTPLAPMTPSFDLDAVLALLAGAEHPLVVAGDGVGRACAVPELVRLVDALGADVAHAPMHDRLNFPMTHPRHRGMLLPENEAIRAVLDQYDVVLLVGLRAFVPHHFSPAAAVGPATTLVQIDDDSEVIGRNYPARLGLCGPVRPIVASLADRLADSGPASARPADAAHSAGTVAPPPAEGGAAPLAADTAAAVLAGHLPEGAVVVEEAITTGLLLRRHLRLEEPGSFHHTVGGGLGWGLGAAVGMALARPDRPVFAALGDGCALFGLQGLWTAARERVAATFVVFGNGEYRTLKQTLTRMRGGRPGRFEGMDLAPPRMDWRALAAGFGVAARTVDGAAELAEVVSSRRPGQPPLLVEVPVRPFEPPHDPGDGTG